jgi:hypothetical protein
MKSHAFDAISFITGLVATSIGLLFLIPQDPGDVFELVGDIGTWFWPVVLVAIGLAILIPLFLKAGVDEEEDETI